MRRALVPALRDALRAALGDGVSEPRRVGGGDLNDAYAADLDAGRRVFVKTAADAAPGAFAGEARALRWLADAGAISVPRVLAVADEPGAARFLALEWIERGDASATTSEELGRGIAALHGAGAKFFGGEQDLVLGPLTLPNEPLPRWSDFYARRRLEPLARIASERGALPAGTAARLERLIGRLDEIAGPDEPPARLHGDLWSGNVMVAEGGTPYLIDPAAYGGHREVDLAMLRLFGAPEARCFAAYEEIAPLAEGHEERVALWQVMPLLTHAALFGGSWGSSADQAIRHYVG
jgi:fructosamine-3-kinase